MNKYLDEFGNVLEYSRDSELVQETVAEYERKVKEAQRRMEELKKWKKERQLEFVELLEEVPFPDSLTY